MKEITKKILESGLVGSDLAQAMEKWGNLEHGASEIVGTKPVTLESLKQFADDLALLVHRDDPFRETVLDLYSIGGEEYIIASPGKKAVYGVLELGGNLIVGVNTHYKAGDIIALYKKGQEAGHVLHEVYDSEPIYKDEQIHAHRVVLNIKR